MCMFESPSKCTCIYMYSLFLYIFALHVSGAICTHPQEHKLQSTAISTCNGYGILIHWSRYWLGHPQTFSTVKFRRESKTQFPKMLHLKTPEKTRKVPNNINVYQQLILKGSIHCQLNRAILLCDVIPDGKTE
jgi:hypothetical protein